MSDDLGAPFENEDALDGLDLTPRHAPPVGGGDTDRTRRVVVLGVLAVLAAALVFMAYQGLSDASVFFRNADEAVAEPDQFAVSHGGVEVDVVHRGHPPELFQPGIPVVLEGRWSQTDPWFESDEILVKHEEDYEAENPERTDDYVGEETVTP